MLFALHRTQPAAAAADSKQQHSTTGRLVASGAADCGQWQYPNHIDAQLLYPSLWTKTLLDPIIDYYYDDLSLSPTTLPRYWFLSLVVQETQFIRLSATEESHNVPRERFTISFMRALLLHLRSQVRRGAQHWQQAASGRAARIGL